MNQKIQSKIIDEANKLGFCEAVFISIPKLTEWEKEVNWRIKFDGLSRTEWEKDCPQNNPFERMPNAESVLMLAWSMPPFKEMPITTLECSSYYIDNKKHLQLLMALKNICKDNGIEAMLANHLPIKPIVASSGIGEYGKQGLIHFKDVGTFVRISLFLTNLGIEKCSAIAYNKEREMCKNCNRCVEACPVGAIADKGHVNRNLCIRQYMLSGKIIPRKYRDKMGQTLVGCETCQLVCPDNAKMIERAIRPNKQYVELFDIESILKESVTSLKPRITKMKEVIGANYARATRVLSAAIIAAGNSKDQRYLPYLYRTIFHDSEVIAVHSVWAIAKIGGIGAWEFLNKQEKTAPETIKQAIKVEKSHEF